MHKRIIKWMQFLKINMELLIHICKIMIFLCFKIIIPKSISYFYCFFLNILFNLKVFQSINLLNLYWKCDWFCFRLSNLMVNQQLIFKRQCFIVMFRCFKFLNFQLYYMVNNKNAWTEFNGKNSAFRILRS